MAEQLNFGWVYDLTPLATFRMVTRLEHLTEQARQLGHQQPSILELRERDGLFRQVTRRQMDTEAGTRGRLFSGPPMLTQTYLWEAPKWDGSRRYQASAEISGTAVSIVGDGAVIPIGAGGTRLSINLTIEAAGRAGRRSETGIAESLAKTIQAEHTFRVHWLERPTHSGF